MGRRGLFESLARHIAFFKQFLVALHVGRGPGDFRLGGHDLRPSLFEIGFGV
jgi:hypothetical protein